MPNPAIQRILSEIGDEQLLDRLSNLAPADLNSLLLEIFKQRASSGTPAGLMTAYEKNRFVVPSTVSQLILANEEVPFLQLATDQDFESIELSPLAPLGNCSVIGLVDQNKVVSASRATEVVADATNLMALECANRRKQGSFDRRTVNLCTIHRHVRAQTIHVPGFTPHFKIFCAVTGGPDRGNLEFEKNAMIAHLRLYRDYLSERFDMTAISVIIKGIESGADPLRRSDVLYTALRNHLPDLNILFADVPAEEHRYYDHTRFSVNISTRGKEYNIGDGGFVDWAGKLTSNGKEKMFTSALGFEFLIKLKAGLV